MPDPWIQRRTSWSLSLLVLTSVRKRSFGILKKRGQCKAVKRWRVREGVVCHYIRRLVRGLEGEAEAVIYGATSGPTVWLWSFGLRSLIFFLEIRLYRYYVVQRHSRDVDAGI